MNLLPSPETRAAVLKHPVFLAGLAVVALLAITAAVLVVIDSARGGNAEEPRVEIEPKTATPGARAKTAVAIGVTGRTRGVTSVHFAPGSNTQILGTLPRGRDVQIDGRTTDSGWFRIIFPPNSELHGWVEADALDITGDAESLVVATAEPPISVDLPTEPASRFTPGVDDTPAETPTPEASPTPAGLPDLVVGTTPVISNGQLFVTVVNQGTVEMTGDLVVAIFNPDATQLLGGATLSGFTLGPGLSIDVGTGYAVTQSQSLLIIVDPNGTIEETDNTNNQVLISVAVGEPPPPPPEEPVTPQIAPSPAPPALPNIQLFRPSPR